MRSLNNMSIRNKLVILFLVIILFTSFTISIFSYRASEATIREQTERLISTSIAQTVKRFDQFMQNVHRATLSVAFNKDLKKMLLSSSKGSQEDYNNLLRITDLASTFNNTNAFVYLMEIYDFHNNLVIPSKGGARSIDPDSVEYKLMNKMYFTNDSAFIPPSQWIPSRMLEFNGVKKNVITFSIPIRDDYSGTVIGSVLTYVPNEYVTQLCKELSSTAGDVVILNETQQVIFSSDATLLEQNFTKYLGDKLTKTGTEIKVMDGQNDILTLKKSDYLEWSFLSIVPLRNIMQKNTKVLGNSFIFISLITIVIAILLSIIINLLFYKPIKKLIRQIKFQGTEQALDKVLISRNDEIGFLFRSFTNILSRNRELMESNFQQKLYLRDAEISLLHSQINPHFLYNTLDSIIWMQKFQQYEEIPVLVKAMIKFFRLSLNKGKEIIIVKEAKEQIESYFVIQQIRYSDRLKVELEFEESILEMKMLKLLLQPLVENAIYHGIEKKPGEGFIKVKGRAENGMLLFQVYDNGVGVSKQRLEEIDAIIRSEEQSDESFYALQNINRRIKLYYGEPYGICMESIEGQGTSISIRIPIL